MRRWQRGKGGKRKAHTDAFGRKLKSGFEVKVSNALGRGWAYEGIKLPYVLENNYHPDFPSTKIRGLYIEAKGKFTGADRRKMLAVKERHANCDIRIVFMRDNKLNKASKTTYTMWAAKHGFPCSVFPKLPI